MPKEARAPCSGAPSIRAGSLEKSRLRSGGVPRSCSSKLSSFTSFYNSDFRVGQSVGISFWGLSFLHFRLELQLVERTLLCGNVSSFSKIDGLDERTAPMDGQVTDLDDGPDRRYGIIGRDRDPAQRCAADGPDVHAPLGVDGLHYDGGALDEFELQGWTAGAGPARGVRGAGIPQDYALTAGLLYSGNQCPLFSDSLSGKGDVDCRGIFGNQ